MPDPLDPPFGAPAAPPPEPIEEATSADGWRPETPDMWVSRTTHPPEEVSQGEPEAANGEVWQPDSAEAWARAKATVRSRQEVGDLGPAGAPTLGDRHRHHGSGYRRSRRSSRSRKRRRRLFVLLGIGVFLLLGGLIVADGYLQTYRIYQHVRELQPELSAARSSLARGRIPEGDPFARASEVASSLQSDIDHARFTFTVTGWLPFVDRPVKAARLAVHAAGEDAQAATIVRDIVAQLLGHSAPGADGQGQGSPVFQDGVVDVDLLSGLTPKLQEVQGHLQAAARDIRAIPTIPLFHGVNALRDQAIDESNRVMLLTQRTLSAVRLLPSFLAAGGERTYFVAFQQNAALRGTGGSVLAYALMNVSNGAISLERFGSIYDIDNRFHGVHGKLPDAVSWYVENAKVNPRIANGSNYSPDFPAVAQAWRAQVAQATGERIDGVIAIDPYAVKALMAGGAPIKVESYPDPITADNVVQVVEHEQFLLPKAQQDVLPAQLIHRTFTRVLTTPPNLVGMLHNLADVLAQKRFQIWSDRPDEVALLRRLGWDGALRTTSGDFLDLASENRIGNKLDYFLGQSIVYTATVRPNGSVDSDYRVTLTNGVPTPVPTGFSGLYGPPRFLGLVREMMNLYVPKAARFESVDPTEIGGPGPEKVHPPGFVQHVEGDFRVFTQTVTVSPDESVPLTFRYSVPGVVQTTSSGHVYQLTVQHQPLATPADFTLRLVLPADADPVLGPGWRLEGNVAVYHASLTRDLVLKLAY